MIYFAHRGANSLAVQNTVPAFEKARALGAQYYELDVHLTADGQLAVHHDYSILQTAGIETDIGLLSARELKEIPLKNSFSEEPVFVPLLQEVLPAISPQLRLLNIELKNDENRYPGIEKRLLAFLQEQAADLLPKILFSSFNADTLARLRALDKNARIGLLTRNFDVSQAVSLGSESVHMNRTRFSSAIAKECHEHQLKLYLYTVNEPEEAQRLARAGADGIFTDRIDLLVKP